MKCFGSARVQKILEDIKILNGQNFEIKDKCYEYVQAEMKKLNNPYILLAYKFVLYNNGIQDQTEDYDFYKYLKTLNNAFEYSFPISENEKITIKVDLFNPFLNFEKGIIDPKWHLLVSCFTYIDAALNHDNEYSEAIRKKTGWTAKKKIFFSCASLNEWVEELAMQADLKKMESKTDEINAISC